MLCLCAMCMFSFLKQFALMGMQIKLKRSYLMIFMRILAAIIHVKCQHTTKVSYSWLHRYSGHTDGIQ